LYIYKNKFNMDDIEEKNYRMELFRNSPNYKWPKVDSEEMIKPHSKKGRKPKPSKRIINKSSEHYKWWRD